MSVDASEIRETEPTDEDKEPTLQQAASQVTAKNALRQGVVAPTIVRQETPVLVSTPDKLPFFNAESGIVIFLIGVAVVLGVYYFVRRQQPSVVVAQTTGSSAFDMQSVANGTTVTGVSTNGQIVPSVSANQIQNAQSLGIYAFQQPSPYTPIY